MNWGRCASDPSFVTGLHCWHALVNGKPFCNKGAAVVETRTDAPVVEEHRCVNCDGKLRERGQSLREAKEALERSDPTILIPTNTFRKWENLP